MSPTPAALCPNCGHRLAPWDRFCAQCGQSAVNHPPTLWEFVHEFVLHYFAAEGALWRSLRGLLLRPGFLTQEYLAGRRQRYVLPLRLLLTLGIVFFMALKLAPHEAAGQDPVQFDGPEEKARLLGGAAPASAASAPASEDDEAEAPTPSASDVIAIQSKAADSVAKALREAQAAAKPGGPPVTSQLPASVGEPLVRAAERWRADPSAASRTLGRAMLAMAPYAVLCSLPFFAALLKLIHWRRRLPYGVHFVFAMHLHAAWYAILLGFLVPFLPLNLAAWAWMNAYPLLAMKRVYGGGWWGTLLRGLLLAALHWVLLLLGLAVLVLLGSLSLA